MRLMLFGSSNPDLIVLQLFARPREVLVRAYESAEQARVAFEKLSVVLTAARDLIPEECFLDTVEPIWKGVRAPSLVSRDVTRAKEKLLPFDYGGQRCGALTPLGNDVRWNHPARPEDTKGRAATPERMKDAWIIVR